MEAAGTRLDCTEVSEASDNVMTSECKLPAKLFIDKNVEVTAKMFCSLEDVDDKFEVEWGKFKIRFSPLN